ncbi:MAG TPA: hypothetical protein DCR62_02055 [Acholeplasmatales bacterium]|nr:hypothetical protein [Acholeplasmatales bacterium]
MNKKLSGKLCLFTSIIILLSFLSFVSGCTKKYKVTFIVDDETYKTIEVKKGDIVEEVKAPTKDNHYFKGWFDENNVFDFSTSIQKDYHLVARYDTFCDVDGHSWIAADCTHPKTCEICGETDGIALGHMWEEATSSTSKTCTRCGKTEGDPLPEVESIEANYTKEEIYIGDTLQFIPTIYPVGAIQDVTYSLKLEDGALATIDENGLFEALHEGKVYITICSVDNTYVACVVEVLILHPLIEDGGYDVFNIMTSYGTDASTDIEINYHTFNTVTEVEYTLASDVTFTNVTTITGSGYYFTEGTDIVESTFIPRNVIRVSIKGLEPDTEYIYRINLGNDTYSEVYRFKTAKDDGSDSAFIMMADIHYYYKTNEDGSYESHGSEISEGIMQKMIEMNPNVGFVATAGDIIDVGGSAKTWDVFFKESNSLKFLPRVGVAGNHEYYIRGTGQSDGRYQKAHYATVNNGPSTQLGLSAYFVYNDILFITVDNEKSEGRNEMLVWLEEVLSTVEYRYSFVMMHTPVYYENSESGNKDRDEVLLGIFEKYCVDLVIAGHYHGDRYRPDYYEGADSSDAGLGVNYMTLSFGGVKSRSDSNLATGYLVETHEGTITIKRVNELGAIVSTRTIVSKRNKPVTTETKENLIQAVNGVYNEENHTYVLNFSDKFYGNVKEVKVSETIRGQINTNVVFPTSSYTKLVIKNIDKFYDYHFKITLVFTDGTTHELTKTLKLGPDIHLEATNITSTTADLVFEAADVSLTYTIKDYVIYVNGEMIDIISYLDDSFTPITSYKLSSLVANSNYHIKLVARNYRGVVMYEVETDFKTLE